VLFIHPPIEQAEEATDKRVHKMAKNGILNRICGPMATWKS
jgi:hypothetical protein